MDQYDIDTSFSIRNEEKNAMYESKPRKNLAFLRSTGSWRWYINMAITGLNVINFLSFVENIKFLRMGFVSVFMWNLHNLTEYIKIFSLSVYQ
jgi:hypothetical protein